MFLYVIVVVGVVVLVFVVDHPVTHIDHSAPLIHSDSVWVFQCFCVCGAIDTWTNMLGSDGIRVQICRSQA